MMEYTYMLGESVGAEHAYCDMAEPGGEYYRIHRYGEDGYEVTGNAIILGYWPASGRAAVCDGGDSTWLDAASPEEALAKWAAGDVDP